MGCMTAVARAVAVVALAFAALHLDAVAALADPAGPTNYRSTVIDVRDADGQPVDLDVEVLGGDAYVVLTAPQGADVRVPGYDGEPYIRFNPDGTVEVNQRSPARWLNDGRYGELDAGVEVPPNADPEAPPAWQLVARSGTYAWHDHRIHFMSPSLPSQVDPSSGAVQAVWDWEVTITVDDQPVVIAGQLDWVPGTTPAVPIVSLLAALAAGVLIARRWGPTPLVVSAAVIAFVLGLSQNLGLPPGADGLPAMLVLPVGSLVVLLVASKVSSEGDLRGPVLRTLAALPSLVTALLIAGALTRPIVPGLLPAVVVRIGVVFVIAASVASLWPLVGRLWDATSLDREDTEEDAASPSGSQP